MRFRTEQPQTHFYDPAQRTGTPNQCQDPFDRLQIQDGFTYTYTPQVMTAWVTGSPNWRPLGVTSTAYRFLVSMQ